VFALLIAFGARSLSTAYEKVTRFERWGRRITAVLFLAVGVYYTLIYNFGVMIG
jgi:threonine/homoserine/homoserine lactone efflux protein